MKYFKRKISIIEINDASFIGANVKANDTLSLNVGNNLVLESLRDEYSSNSNGFNVNAGIGFGSAGAPAKRSPSFDVGKQSSTNAGFSVNNGTTLNKQTVLSSITGNEVNVNVGNNTHLKGALISAGNFTEDGSFVDNKNLNFTTNTLSFENLSNTTYSSNQSIGGSLNYNLTDSRIVNTEEKKDIEKSISSVKYNSDKSLSVNVSKTLATLGQGNINIKDTANSDDLERLNSDTSKINKDLYSSSTGTKVDATLDTRLLSIKGIDQIKDDYNTATAITNAIEQIVTNNKVGIIDFFNETQKNVDVYNGVKAKIANDEELAKQLQNSDLNPTDKQNMLKEVALTVMKELGYVSNDVKIVSTDDIGKNETLVKGYYDPKTQTSFVNDKYNDSTTELLASLGHEISHDMDKQNGIFVSNDKDQNIYATNFGEDLAFYTNGALDIIKGGSLSNTNNHNNGIVITTMPSIFNSSNNVLNSNNVQFSLLDKSGGDDSISKIVINVNEYKNKTNYGTALVYVDGESKPREIKITSGRDTFDYTKSNAGPTPPGVYLIDPNKSQNMSVNDRIDGINQSTNELSLFNFIKKYSDDWGIFRVPLEPANSTNTYNRTGMYIHGGTFDGSIGCIDCGNNDKWLFGEVRDTKKFIPVEIKYDENYKK